MSTLVIVLRIVSLLAFAGPMLMGVSGRRRGPETRARQRSGDRAPMMANLAAFGLFFPSLLVFSGSPAGFTALLLASSGSILAIAGAALVRGSRRALRGASRFGARADQDTGAVTTGRYRFRRRPVYLALAPGT